jgi:hypothetical protein
MSAVIGAAEVGAAAAVAPPAGARADGSLVLHPDRMATASRTPATGHLRIPARLSMWLQTLGDGLVRADQVARINAHQTPALSGKPSHWLLDVVLPAQVGSGTGGAWRIKSLLSSEKRPAVDPRVCFRAGR